jgi:Fe-S cluster assembly iron-binding protein IscA
VREKELVQEAGVITVTERAKEELKDVLIAAEAGPDEGLRLMPTSDGTFELMLDTEMSGDLVVEYEGYKVLLIGLEYFKFLNGKTLDCSDTDVGAVLFVR